MTGRDDARVARKEESVSRLGDVVTPFGISSP